MLDFKRRELLFSFFFVRHRQDAGLVTYVSVVVVARHPTFDEFFDVSIGRLDVGLRALNAANHRHHRLARRSPPVDLDHPSRSIQSLAVGVEPGQVHQEVRVVPFLHSSW